MGEAQGPAAAPARPSVRQLAPDSALISWLATEDVTIGTRVLSLASAGDAIVPARRSILTGARNHVLAPAGWNAHAALVRSAAARSYAYAFLRDGPPACGGPWDGAGAAAGEVIDFAARHAGDVLRAVEPPGAAPAARALQWLGERAEGALRWVGGALSRVSHGVGSLLGRVTELGARGLRSLQVFAAGPSRPG